MNGNLTYNTNDLQTYDPITRVGIITNLIRHTDMPESIGDVVPLANASDSDAPTNEYPNRIVVLGGSIHGSTQADLDSRVDAFKAIFVPRYKDLDIVYAGSVRRYQVIKVSAMSVERQDKALFAAFEIELICKPFGQDITTTVIANETALADTPYTAEFTIGGTAPYQQPIATITINAFTGEGDYLQLSNDQNGQEIIITGQGLEAGDVVKINSETRAVTINDIEVDYSGTFIELEPGAHSLTLTDGFATRDIDILIEYYKRYM